ncbi:MAG: hypothetical protein KGL69_10445 [Alphaproteobacteria bacterium]|nr:hypothetical protein [Alphaproteobacteria bacterium]
MKFGLTVGLGALLLAGAAMAQPVNGAPNSLTTPTTATSSPSVPPQVPGPMGDKKKDPVICKHQEEIGSRLGGKSICLRKSQWERQAYDAQHDTQLFQSQPH